MLVSKYGTLSSVDRARAIGHLEAGWKQRDVAVLFGVSQSTISRLRLICRDTHDMKDRPRKWETTYHHRQSGSFNSPDNFEESSHHCTQPTDALSRTLWQAVSIPTTRNRLHASQLKSRKDAQKPLLPDGVTIEFIDGQSFL